MIIHHKTILAETYCTLNSGVSLLTPEPWPLGLQRQDERENVYCGSCRMLESCSSYQEQAMPSGDGDYLMWIVD